LKQKTLLTAFRNFCCSKFLVRYSTFKILNRPNQPTAQLSVPCLLPLPPLTENPRMVRFKITLRYKEE
jgi:hypothetical protein